MTNKANDEHKQNDEHDEESVEVQQTEEAPEILEDDVDQIIANMQEQIEGLQDKLLRSMAECENVRARTTKLVEEAKEFSITGFAKDLVPVVDNLSRALSHVPDELDENTKMVIEGVAMTKNEFENVFKKHGLVCIEPEQGEKFDYNLHNAISQIVTEEFEPGTIVNTMQAGYKIKGRLLRPASVTVAKK